MSSQKDELLIELGRLTIEIDAQAATVEISRRRLKAMQENAKDLETGIIRKESGYYLSARLSLQEAILAVKSWIGNIQQEADNFDNQVVELRRLEAEIAAVKVRLSRHGT